VLGHRCALVLAACAACASSPSTPFDEAFDEASNVSHVTSLSVQRDGAVVREAYFRGTARTTHDVRSVTKTVTALLIGVAIDTGCMHSLDQPIGELLGELAPADPAKAAITVRDLLSMTSGFEWEEGGAIGYTDWISAPNQVEYLLARPLVTPPGTRFNYNSGALHLLSVILTRACAPTASFADQHLFGPMGIPPPDWEMDEQGNINGAAGIALTTPQLVAIGQLILDRGRFGGAQLVPAAYIDLMTTLQIATGEPDDETPGYGFGIWLGNRPGAGAFAMAEGYGGQFIAIVPQRHAVVVATSSWDDLDARASDNDFTALLHVLVRALLPTL
jgi:CubicO group peptidase (beta-lactamase class C family)